MQRNRRRAVRARGKPHGMGMENYLPLLQSTSLFAGLEAEALRVLLGNVGAVLRTYSRGETLVLAGQTNRRVGRVCPSARWGRAAYSAMCWAARAFPAR